MTTVTDNQYILKAIHLADGWEWDDHANYTAITPDGEYWHWAGKTAKGVIYQDALAAQLVRQVDALDCTHVEVDDRSTIVRHVETCVKQWIGSDRTMNTIKAIVESGVLQQQRNQT